MLIKKSVFVVVLLVLFCLVSVVVAKAIKVPLIPEDSWPEENAWGRVILNYCRDDDTTYVKVDCWGMRAETEYHVIIGRKPNPYADLGNFRTNKNGSGCLYGNFGGEPPTKNLTVRNEDPLIDNHYVLKSDFIGQM